MKKSTLINSEISYLVATLGHTDEITVCDAGLPIQMRCNALILR
ncbi:ribose ABC transport system [Vibrio ishigakensis]|uniref:D-ribose pyranase n=1 Tax=Vibrio ishigakensis TaxID=1481914 RepID=A0A0B8P9A2_9VIBR|nr:ribose ABC transport system [Vibrio ishigakensis]